MSGARGEVDSFAKLHEALSPYRSSSQWLFRGRADVAWKLVGSRRLRSPVPRFVTPDDSIDFKEHAIKRFRPTGYAARLNRQGAGFTVHHPPTLALQDHLPEDHALGATINDR